METRSFLFYVAHENIFDLKLSNTREICRRISLCIPTTSNTLTQQYLLFRIQVYLMHSKNAIDGVNKNLRCLQNSSSQYRRRLRRQQPAAAMRHCQLRPRHLARSTLPTQLPHRLDNQKDTAHSGMVRGKAAAIGIDRKLPAERDASILYKRAPFALLAKSQVFQQKQHCDSKRIVDHRHIDIRRRYSGFGKSAWSSHSSSRHRQIGHLRDMRVRMAFAAAQDINGRLFQTASAFFRRHQHRSATIAHHAAIEQVQ